MLGGTVSDFDAAQPSMQTVLARETDTSTDSVYLTLTAGSVIVEADIYFGTADGATFAVSQLLAGIFASPAALETALNIQFEEDGQGVTASVQQILAAPEYVTVDAAMIGIGVGVGLGALLLLVGGVALLRRRKKTAVSSLASSTASTNGMASAPPTVQMSAAIPAPQAVPPAPPPQIVLAQPQFVQPQPIVAGVPLDLVYCTKCGVAMQESANFCQGCGAQRLSHAGSSVAMA